jgi:hypothetical protein
MEIEIISPQLDVPLDESDLNPPGEFKIGKEETITIMTGFFRGLLDANPDALIKSENIDSVASKFTTAVQCFGKTTPDVITGSKLMLESI